MLCSSCCSRLIMCDHAASIEHPPELNNSCAIGALVINDDDRKAIRFGVSFYDPSFLARLHGWVIMTRRLPARALLLNFFRQPLPDVFT